MWCAVRKARRGGFSLVEVTVALGLCTFVLLGLIGLMAAGLTSARDASRDTALAGMAEHVLGDLVSQPYGQLVAGQPPVYWFTNDGARLAGESAEAIYRCDVTLAPAEIPLIPAALQPDNPSEQGLRARLSFHRKTAPNEPAQVFETAIASY